MRKSGYYWVLNDINWVIAEYISEYGFWALHGYSSRFMDRDWDEIDETPIERKPSDTIIQSEEKERRELLEKYTVYLNKTNRLKNLYVEPFDLIDSFLESENK